MPDSTRFDSRVDGGMSTVPSPECPDTVLSNEQIQESPDIAAPQR